MHPAAFRYVEQTVRDQGFAIEELDVLEIGSYIVNGTIRPLFDGAKSYTGIDLRSGPGVDEVADGATFGEDASYDLVVCCEALEHYYEPALVIENAARVLRPGGYLILTAASLLRAPHGNDGNAVEEGEFYGGIDPELLQIELGEYFRYSVVVENKTAGDVYAFAQLDDAE